MNVNELREKIDQHLDSIQAKQESLNKIRQHIIDEIKPFIKTELQKTVDNEVTYDAIHTKELGVEKLSSMKQQLLDLLDRSDSLVEEIFSDDDFWFHVNIGTNKIGHTYEDDRIATQKINEGIRLALGAVGKLFQVFGYIEAQNKYRRENGSHRNFNLVSDNQPQDKLFYRGYVETPKTLQLLIEEYANRIGPLHQEYIEISDLQEKLLKQEASDLWNGI